MCNPPGILATLCCTVLIFNFGCSPAQSAAPATIEVHSSAFDQDGPIPAKYTGDGQNISPPLSWNNLPPGTMSLALIVEDPDAPGSTPFCHWAIANLPPTLPGLAEGADIPSTAIVGRNDFGGLGYGGPAPPPGKVHHYHFRLFALDAMLHLGDSPDRPALLNAMNGHILAQGELVAIFQQ